MIISLIGSTIPFLHNNRQPSSFRIIIGCRFTRSFADKNPDQSRPVRQGRLRAHHNLHEQLEDGIQRLAIAMAPDTYVRPHRRPGSPELLIMRSGWLGLKIKSMA
ncbi:WbuC family cupin fold metalloprotein [Chromobacterium subtsugae]|uniref:WbuC family cupin fold metalloprotein n=1 Tax=Chromobacterium subtsugae TaxID=251747 RepID=A0ABS7F9G1_9NEIS|nr:MULTISPECIES: WbuC family cupin fold metalloprotein [Chromobacterium]MBW7565061.1 WbuC family cupin fold metalloprotein [Chromobacterium subtsugae]MBW8286411.1 WbuC family cupin fold metalloprotein [Chromobacterium subtsugae]WSE91545.1 WbuC family cupin fold metalloprotein [Chromobacterium subtsugae]WVH59920.1 WbuC family cupin fold metalloprotein [Chromobacterium subtsugae]